MSTILDEYVKFSHVLTEPAMLVTGDGRIVAANAPLRRAIGRNFRDVVGENLFDVAFQPREKIERSLRACSQARQAVVGALSLRTTRDEPFRFQYKGGLL